MSTTNDNQMMLVEKELWDGDIPVKVTLAPSENTTLLAPSPVYAMVPRQSYFPLWISHVLEYFQEYVPLAGSEGGGGSSVWFDYNGIPLQWQIPVGVLYDWLVLSKPQDNIPWELTIHFQGFPTSKILPWPTISAHQSSIIESHYMHSLKQSCFAKFKTVKLVMEMPQALQSQLWMGIQQNSYEIFNQAYSQIASKDKDVKSIPLRLYLPNTPAIQLPIDPIKSEQQPKTLYDVLSYLVPDLVLDLNNLKVIIHSVDVTSCIKECNIRSIYETLKYPDGFLYIVCSVKTN